MEVTQLSLVFPVEQLDRKRDSVCVVQWQEYHGEQRLHAWWPVYRIGSYHRDWPSLIAHVLHPNNETVRLKVRA